MKHIKIFFFFFFMACVCGVSAQQAAKDEDKGVALSVWLPDNNNDLPAEAQQSLYNKLLQIISKQKISSDPSHARFIITANVAVQEKFITPTAPPKHSYKLDVTFYIGDGFEGNVFSSYTTSVTGIGDNDTKACMDALKNIKVADPNYKKFIDQGKAKIVEYFNGQCDVVAKEAKMLATTQKFDEALWKLTSIPASYTDCWDKNMEIAATVFQQKIDYECAALLSKATSVWSAGQNWDAAEQAAGILSGINPKSKCFGDVVALSEKIAATIKEADQREWVFKYDKEIEAQKEAMNIYRELSTTWAENQPKEIYKILQ